MKRRRTHTQHSYTGHGMVAAPLVTRTRMRRPRGTPRRFRFVVSYPLKRGREEANKPNHNNPNNLTTSTIRSGARAESESGGKLPIDPPGPACPWIPTNLGSQFRGMIRPGPGRGSSSPRQGPIPYTNFPDYCRVWYQKSIFHPPRPFFPL